ncbi:amidase [Agrobacterium rosae]|uniref:Urethanase n=2 Tax=Agrobacterium TaxID=357 RepID=AMDA_AGRTU|nr:amidase [Agrobacterium rosae]AAK28498.1 enantioselective amidase [Agrobacterium tumefaciens]MDX8304452.1 amidase [Agrobacterium rosae]
MSLGPELATKEQIREIAADYGLPMTDEEVADHIELLKGAIASYRELEHIPERKLPVKYPRTPGWRPTTQENPLNGWYWRCEIEGAKEGPLKGDRIAIKDVVCVAGVPMMNGSKLLEGYVPEIDATIVTRMLDAGATIVGKSACEDFSFSAGGMTCSTGPVGNPYDPTRNPGASSNGSAVLISTGQVDLAIGGDQGGSIRLPSAWCGVYGLKPTYGLVPYTGCAMIEGTLDHVGPMASSPKGIAKLLSVIAGYDADDPRQQGRIVPGFDTNYLPALERGVKGMKIAILKEGFGHDGSDGMLASDPLVDDCVRSAMETFRGLGAEVAEVSIPEHLTAWHIWTAIGLEGFTAFGVNGNGVGTNWNGWYNTSMAEYLARAMKSRPYDMPATVRSVLIRGEYFRRYYHNRYYGKAQNQRHLINEAYDRVLSEYDIIVCPTIPGLPTKMVDRDAGTLDTVVNQLNQLRNTAVCDLTGHPSMSVPCGLREGLPVGMMLTAKHFDDATLIAAAAAFEAAGDWRKM